MARSRRMVATMGLVLLGAWGAGAKGDVLYSNYFTDVAGLSATASTSFECVSAPGGKNGMALRIFGGDGTVNLAMPQTWWVGTTVLFRFYVTQNAATRLYAYRFGPGEGFQLFPSGSEEVFADSNSAWLSRFSLNTWYTVALHQRSYGPVDIYLKEGAEAVLTESDYMGTVTVYPQCRLYSITFGNQGGGGEWYIADFVANYGNNGADFTIPPGPSSVTGKVALEGFHGDLSTVRVTVDLNKDTTTVRSEELFLKADGAFAIPNVPQDTYQVRVKAPYWLSGKVDGVTVLASPKDIGTIELKGGDATGDDHINFEDFSVLQNSYGQSGAAGSYPPAANAGEGASAVCVHCDNFTGPALDPQWTIDEGGVTGISNGVTVTDPSDGPAWTNYGFHSSAGYATVEGDVSIQIDMKTLWTAGYWGANRLYFITDDGASAEIELYLREPPFTLGAFVNGSSVGTYSTWLDTFTLRIVRTGTTVQMWWASYQGSDWTLLGSATGFSTRPGTVKIEQSWPDSAGDSVLWTRFVVTPEQNVVQGTVNPVGYRGDRASMGVTVDFIQDNTIVRSECVVLNADGKFSVPNVPEGTYMVTIKGPGCLSGRVDTVEVLANPTDVGTIDLKGGDFNGDDQVSFEDFAILQNNYGQSGIAGSTPLAAAAGVGGCGPLGLLVLSILGLALRYEG